MVRIPIKSNPKLFDKAFSYIQEALGVNIPWLDHIFGKAERLVKDINGKRYYTPNVFVGGKEYEDIEPDTRYLGNYSFFTLDEPQELSHEVGENTHLKAPFSLIVWCDLRKVGMDAERNTEAVKQELLQCLHGSVWMRHGHFKLTKVWEKAENIFKGFTLDEIDSQFLMQPYCGWRFEGIIEISTECAL